MHVGWGWFGLGCWLFRRQQVRSLDDTQNRQLNSLQNRALFSAEEYAVIQSNAQMFTQALCTPLHASSDTPNQEAIEVVTRVQSGRHGRPRLEFNRAMLAQALETRNQTEVASEWGVSYKTIHRNALAFGLIQPGQHPFPPQAEPEAQPEAGRAGGEAEVAVVAGPPRQSRTRGRRELTDEELAGLVQECLTLFQIFGRNMVMGFLASRAVYASRDRIEAAVLRVNGIPRLFGDRIERRVYAIAGPNAVWHHDGQHGEHAKTQVGEIRTHILSSAD